MAGARQDGKSDGLWGSRAGPGVARCCLQPKPQDRPPGPAGRLPAPAAAAAAAFVRAPVAFLGAAGLALRMARRSHRPWPYHLVYLAEGARLAAWLRRA